MNDPLDAIDCPQEYCQTLTGAVCYLTVRAVLIGWCFFDQQYF